MGKRISELDRQTNLIQNEDYVILDRGNTPFRARGWVYKDGTSKWMNSPVRYYYEGSAAVPISASTRGEVYDLGYRLLQAVGYNFDIALYPNQGLLVSIIRNNVYENPSYMIWSPDIPPFLRFYSYDGSEDFESGDTTALVGDIDIQTLYGKLPGSDSITQRNLVLWGMDYE